MLTQKNDGVSGRRHLFIKGVLRGLVFPAACFSAVRSFFDVGEGFDEVAEDLGRDHDGISVSADVFGDFDDPTTAIFF